ncbi:mannose-1-phosphate guanylyltransferase [Trueperella sp. LYQ143]|uniref:mannose-1-phosphate guanylyltransferase n=1 Tax=unclassified Trueperella TaxID=2630174 RepID=UPI00398300D6
MQFHAIIPAGGAGTRLWPLSRRTCPKFLADLTGCGRTLLQQTVDRLQPIAQTITVVTGEAHASAVREQVPDVEVLVEPSARDSMAAIGLAAAVIRQRHGDVVVGSFAADHLISDVAAFHRAVRDACAAADQGYVTTIGITPDSPATGFGYIRASEPIAGLARVLRVQAFAEKPDAQTAREYLASGNYRWNAGMFVARSRVLLDALARFEPQMAADVEAIAVQYDSAEREAVMGQYWPRLKRIAIDHAIAEPLAAAGGVAVVPVEMGWSDVGDFASLRDVIMHDAAAAQQMSDSVIEVGCSGTLAYSQGKPVVVVGVDDAVVVEMDDVIMVTTRRNAQNVKQAPELLSNSDLQFLC